MSKRWTILCLLLVLSLVASTVSMVEIGTTARADNGNGNGNGSDNKDKDKEKKDKDKERGNGNDAVEPAAPYRVEVSCAPGEAADQTTCTFTGVTPDGAKKIGHVDLPAADICAAVLGGDAEYVDPDPNTGVVGYKSRGGDGEFSLILAGEVAPGGTATYWVKAGNGVFPATGPGLTCDATTQPEAAAATEINVTGTLASSATPAAAASGGAAVVHTYSCAADAETTAVDWFSACEPGVPGVRFTLSTSDPTLPETIGDGETDPTGEITFDGLAPGSYQLDAPDVVWCHAESDNVNDRGELVVIADAVVSVWIFLCGAEPAA